MCSSDLSKTTNLSCCLLTKVLEESMKMEWIRYYEQPVRFINRSRRFKKKLQNCISMKTKYIFCDITDIQVANILNH